VDVRFEFLLKRNGRNCNRTYRKKQNKGKAGGSQKIHKYLIKTIYIDILPKYNQTPYAHMVF